MKTEHHYNMQTKLTPCTNNIIQLAVTDQPCYLSELTEFYQPVRQCRSSTQELLNRHRSRTVLALRSFKHSSVAVWNSVYLLTFVTVHHLAYFESI